MRWRFALILFTSTLLLQGAENVSLEIPKVGSSWLTVLDPVNLELTYITAKPGEWDFAGNLPDAGQIQVKAGGQTIPVARVGFRRRVLYAPLKAKDLRIGNYLAVQLERPVPEGAEVVVENPDGRLWKSSSFFRAKLDSSRWSPVIHVNHAGYAPDWPKSALLGYFLGDLREMKISGDAGFDVVDDATGKSVFHGKLIRRLDGGFTFPCYSEVLEADFSDLRAPGRYRISVPGLGRSFPFLINEGVPALFARTYGLGIYHQRCGGENAMPFTRFTHKACHTAPASVPTKDSKAVNQILAALTKETKGQHAPPLKDVNSSLFPYVRNGKVDVAGGHHDAGDYSKYTINSAQLIHHLVFAADAFPGVVDLDNLGLPESGDGKSDVLQLAKWEADFLAKMQDDDGAFYFLVYPEKRKYENDVLPDKGDPQVVAPKTSSVTAAAVAALAQIGSSPAFKKQFPQEAAAYIEKAKKGWACLEKAWAQHGRDNVYQRLTHYGDYDGDRDETLWAAAEMYLATGDEKIHNMLLEKFDPSDKGTWRWSWWSLFESYGCAARSYGFADRTGRMPEGKLNKTMRDKCQREILSRAHYCAREARNSAYNTSFPQPSKRFRNGGWYFPSDLGFDITAGYVLDPRPEFLDAVAGNLNYEAGANPVNVSYITGVGWKRQRDVVHQYAQNDRRVLPPSGIPLGSIQSGFTFLDHYKTLLRELSWPKDDDPRNPYPF
jgi:hypothetical protein